MERVDRGGRRGRPRGRGRGRPSPRIASAEQAIRDERRRRERNLDTAAIRFDDEMRSLAFVVCRTCKKRTTSGNMVGEVCRQCENSRTCLFTPENGMDLGIVPYELKNLSLTEQVLIARVHPVVSCFLIKGQQRGYKGHVINFFQNVHRIATQLPDRAALDSLIVLNRQTPDGIAQFRVRSGIVRRALNWLIANNIHYRGVRIDEQYLAQLPLDGNIVHHILPAQGDDDGEEDVINRYNVLDEPANIDDPPEPGIDEELGSLDSHSTQEALEGIDAEDGSQNLFERSGMPNLPNVDQRQMIAMRLEQVRHDLDVDAFNDGSIDENSELAWPTIENQPINEFTTEGLICQAFPALFPYGRGDLRAPRLREISEHKYFKYLMKYHDGRFASDMRFPYFAYNTMVRHDALKLGDVYIRRNEMQGLNNEDLINIANDPNHDLAAHIMYFGSSIRGTKSYWKQRSAELHQMCRQLGSPTVFFTLSAADYHWPDLYRILCPNQDIDRLTQRQRRELMHSNPSIVAWFFEKRVDIFFKEFIMEYFNVVDYWYRYEWQHRGSPHVHGLFWLRDPPTRNGIDPENDEQLQEIIDYFDELVTATVNQIYHLPPHQNPCRQRYSDLSEAEKFVDLDRLLSTVQRHLRCNEHCLKRIRGTRNRKCRFGFPIQQEPQPALRHDEGKWKFFPKRNDSYLQKYNPAIAKVWRGNTDFSAITCPDDVLRYIAKYASKGEVASPAYSDVLKRIMREMPNETSAVTVVRRLMVNSVAERNYSAQEIFHLIDGKKLFSATRTFKVLSLKDDWRRVERNPTSTVSDYANRPENLDDITLLDFAKHHYRRGERFCRRRKEAIVRVYPILTLTDDAEAIEDYYRLQCMLHIPWRGDFEQMRNEGQDWEDIHDDVLIGRADDNPFDNDFPDVQDDVIYEDDPPAEDEIIRDPGMAAARLRPDHMPQDPLGHRPIDEANLWPNFRSVGLTPDNINQFYASYRQTDNNQVSSDDVLPYDQMSAAQKQIIDLVRNQIMLDNYEVKRTLIQGRAGTGKSAVIKATCRELDMISPPNVKSYEVLAPTGVAAANIDGKTIHSFLRIPIVGQMLPMNGENLRTFQLQFRDIKFLIFDEFSMIGKRMLYKIDKRLCQAKGSSAERFGGYNIYFYGDLRQLPPVRDTPIYMQSNEDMCLIADDIISSFQLKILLTVSHRQHVAEVDFRGAIDGVATGRVSPAHWELLMARRLAIVESELPHFDNAIRLFPTNSEVLEFNELALTRTNKPVAVIDANHNNITARLSSDNQAQGLLRKLYLAHDCRIMLRRNLCVSKGLVNGALGYVRTIIFRDDERPPSMPAVLLIEFDRYPGPFVSGRTFPIRPVTASWKDGSVDCTRTQFPIVLAYASTIHKSQGLTLEKAFLEVGRREMAPGLTYVAISRVRRLRDLIFMTNFDYSRLSSISSHRHTIHRERFMIQMNLSS